ncbi:NAD(P)-binding protein [Cubamyces sp. BRFM 1775]|nr:NAD(P)-binding protein [Cubamyces sp. BRFM 1775]
MDTSDQPRIPQPPGTMTAYRFVLGISEPQRETVAIPIPAPDEVLIKPTEKGPPPMLKRRNASPLEPAASRAPASPFRCSDWAKTGPGENTSKARAITIVPVLGNNPGDTRLTPGTVAAATDAVMTPWRALKRVAEVKPGQTIVVLGCGGLGLHAIQIAKRVLGAGTVIASDIKADSLEIARKFGADYAVLPDEIRALLAEKELLVDVVADFVGVQPTFDAGTEMLRTGGTLLFVGLGAESVEIRPLAAAMKQLVIKTTYGGDLVDLQECLHAISEGQIRPEVEQRRMDQCGNVVQGLSKGEIRGRVVLMPPLQ